MRLLILFIIMGLAAVAFAQEFDVRSFEADPTDMAARRYSRTTVNDEPAALIKVITNISGMSFDSNQGIVDVERKEAEYWVYVVPRERRIRLMAPEFLAKDLSLPEPAQSHMVYHLIVTAKGLPETLNVIPVNIIVEGHDDATLFVNEEVFPVNQTISLPRGENAIRIEKQGYRIIDQNIDVNEENTLFRFALEGINEEVVTIRSYPSGAGIIINRVRQDGVTDFQTFLFPGTYDLRLSLDEYKDVETTITVQENQSNEFVFDLERYAGTLTLDITPDDATILINQRNYTGQEQLILAPGMYRLIVEKAGYDSHEERFQITEGQSTDISVVLNPITGSLRFLSSSPDAAYVLINSAGEEVTQWSGTHQIRELPIGSYRYEGALEGYVKLVRQIAIRENEQTTVNAVFTDEMREDYIREQDRQVRIGEQELGEQKEQRQQTISELFQQEKYFSIHLSFTQMNLNTVNFSKNIDGSLGVNGGISYFGNYWGANVGIGYSSLSLKQTARAEFGFDNVGVINYYACIGPKLGFSVFEIFVMAGFEGSRISYGGDTDWQGEVFSGDLILNYGGMILPRNWRLGFRYSGNTALGLLESYPPFSRHEFGLVYKF